MDRKSTPAPDFEKFFASEIAIHKYFGYKEDWVQIPLADHRDYYWLLHQETSGNGEVLYSREPLTVEVLNLGRAYFSAQIYTQRFLPLWVYETDDFTLISMDPRTDGNRFLGIFDNKKKQNEEVLYPIHLTRWSIVRA
jgi:hypothetical protein